MPVTRDTEFEIALEKAMENTMQGWVAGRFVSLGVIVAIFIILFVFEKNTSRLLIEILAIGFVAVIYKIDKGVQALFAAISAQSCATEWFGKKQVGEYEPPSD